MSIYSLNEEDIEFFESLKTFVISEDLSEPLFSSVGELNPFHGHKHTEETKLILSEYAKLRTGDLNPNFGNFWTEEQKQKLSDKKLGTKVSEETKKKLSLAFSGENNPQYGKRGELSSNYGTTLSRETKEKISAKNKGKIISEDSKLKMSIARSKFTGTSHPNYGKTYNMNLQKCPYCNKEGYQNMKRYHFDNCKYKT